MQLYTYPNKRVKKFQVTSTSSTACQFGQLGNFCEGVNFINFFENLQGLKVVQNPNVIFISLSKIKCKCPLCLYIQFSEVFEMFNPKNQ